MEIWKYRFFYICSLFLPIITDINQNQLFCSYTNFITLLFNANEKSVHQKRLEFLMIEVYKYLKDLSHQIMNDIFKLRKNLRNVRLFESQNPRTKQYGLYCITYRASQFWQTFPFEIRESVLLNIFKHNIKTWYCNSIPCYCSKTLHSPLWVYLNVSITLYIFYDGLIHANISENFNLMTNFNAVALLILSDIPYFGVNEA